MRRQRLDRRALRRRDGSERGQPEMRAREPRIEPQRGLERRAGLSYPPRFRQHDAARVLREGVTGASHDDRVERGQRPLRIAQRPERPRTGGVAFRSVGSKADGFGSFM